MSSRRLKYLHLIVIIPLCLQSEICATEWVRVAKPYKIGPVSEISIGFDALNVQYIFAAGDSGSNKLWMTTNGGQDWEVSHNESGYWHTRVVIEKSDFNAGWTLLQGTSSTDAGPYRTTDGGDNWARKAVGIDSPNKLRALAAVGGDLKIAYVGGEGDSDNNFERLYKWDHQNSEWDLSQSGLPENEEGIVHDIAISESDNNYAYLAYDGESGDGIYRTTNGGTSWTRVANFNNAAMAVAIIGSLIGSIAVVEKSPDPGRPWYCGNATAPEPTWRDIVQDLNYLPSGTPECRDAITFYGSGPCAVADFAYETPDNNGIYWWMGRWKGD